MSLFLVRRTRRFVEHRYGETDDQGRRFLRFADGTAFYFPVRIPRPLEYAGGPTDPGDRLASPETVEQLNTLVLPRYRLADFVVAGAGEETKQERQILERLVKSRGNLLGFIRTTLMKRLASCGPSFLASVERHLLRNHITLHALKDRLMVPIGTIEGRRWDDISEDQDPSLEGFELDHGGAGARTRDHWMALAASRHQALCHKPPSKLTWLDSRFFDDRLREALDVDIAILQAILDDHGPWDPAKDSKITALAGLIAGEHQGEKVLIFSEYADTARYVAEELVRRLPETPIAAVTGDTDNPTAAARRFSPHSNATLGGLPAGSTELQVLVATDVLSEGQNLQDAAIVVNYDLPWTIIRLIQRAGRVDRIGQISPTVEVYSFLPQTGVEDVIQLRKRIGQRLRENAEVFGSDEQFFEDDLTEDDLKGLFDGTRSLDDNEVDEDVDWASQALAIWEAATEEQQQRAMSLPDVTYSTRPRREGDEQGGILVYTRTSRGIDGLAFTEPGTEAPVSRVLTPYEGLRIAVTEPNEKPPDRRVDHHLLVARAVSTVLLDSARQPVAITHSGPRARLYRLLTGYREKNTGTFFDTPELRTLIEAVLHTPLKETAKHRIAKALRERSPDDVVALAIDLDEQSGLLVDMDVHDDDIRIVCSLGIPDA